MVEATRAGQEALDVRALETAFDEGSEPLAEFVVGYALAVTSTHMARWLPEAIGETLAAGGNAEARVVREANGFRAAQGFGDLYFDQTNREAVLWAGERSSTLITQITAKTRTAIRATIARSFVEGIPADQSARLLRSSIGLTPRQAGAAATLRAKILAKPGKKLWAGRMPIRVPKAGATIEWLERRVEQYSSRLLNWRARTIARTETIAASNEGQRQLWGQAQGKGLLGPNRLKEWIVTPDDRLCDICEPLQGSTAPINESFPDIGVQGPPAHVACRCAMGISAKRAPVGSRTPLPPGFDDMVRPAMSEGLFRMPANLASRVAMDEAVASDVLKQFPEMLKRLKLEQGISVTLPKRSLLKAATPEGRARIAAVRTGLEATSQAYETMLMTGGRSAKETLWVVFKEEASNIYASAQRGLFINLNHPAWQSRAVLERSLASDAARGFSAGPNFESMIIHEYGHIRHYQNFNVFDSVRASWSGRGESAWGKVSSALSQTTTSMQQTARKVSRYAAVDPAEFVAETFSGLNVGKKYGDDVMDLYRAMHGPELKSLKVPIPTGPSIVPSLPVTPSPPPSPPPISVPSATPASSVIRRVLRLHSQGLSHEFVAQQMGWRTKTGPKRVWNIVKKYGGES